MSKVPAKFLKGENLYTIEYDGEIYHNISGTFSEDCFDVMSEKCESQIHSISEKTRHGFECLHPIPPMCRQTSLGIHFGLMDRLKVTH